MKTILLKLVAIFCYILLSNYVFAQTQVIGNIANKASDTTRFVKETMLSDPSQNERFLIDVPSVVQPSPLSQIFEKYVNHSITEYNGLPDITIPLYEIEVKGLKIPITLTYHASGIQYMQHDGEVGTGWSISATGYRITRTVNGRDDLMFDFYSAYQQQQKQLGQAVATVTSSYDLQGKLTALQSSLFSQQLYYHSSPVTGSTPQYGGNISAVRWTQTGQPEQSYAYTYDGFSRLLSGTHSGSSTSNDESQTYDSNGNMLSITRTGDQAETINMDYTGNRLAMANALAYTYDASGNMTHDGLRDMDITYNRLNLPEQVSKDSDALAYGTLQMGKSGRKHLMVP